MKRLFRLGLLIVVVFAPIRADDPIKFFGDGHDWQEMGTAFSKAMYIDGFKQGLSCAGMQLHHEPITLEQIIETSKAIGEDQTTPNKPVPRIQMVLAVDSFYSDVRNVNIAIPLALRWAKVKLDGGTPEDLGAFAAVLRTNHEEVSQSSPARVPQARSNL